MSHSVSLPDAPAVYIAGVRLRERNDARRLLTRRIAGMIALSEAEQSLLWDVGTHARTFPAETVLYPGRGVHPPRVLLAGWACYRRLVNNGRQQIIRFLLPGDMIGSPLHLDRPSYAEAISLTSVLVGEARPLQTMLARPGHGMPGLVEAFERIEYAEHAGVVDQITRLGRQTAYERFLHLLLELNDRLGAVGHAQDDTFAVPLTQGMFANALGLSVVHVNRVLQQIRRNQLLVMSQGTVKLLNPKLMREKADWSDRSPRESQVRNSGDSGAAHG